MRILVVTTEYPTPEYPERGIFVSRQVDALRAEGLDIDVLHFTSRSRPMNHYRAWRRLRRMLAEKRYDVIHAQYGHSGLISQAQRRLPVVITYRGNGLHGIVDERGNQSMRGRIQIGLCQLLGLTADDVIVVSQRLGDLLWRNDYHVIPSGLDLNRFRPMPRDEARQELGLDPDRRLVMFASQDTTMGNKRFGLAKAAVDRLAGEFDVELKIITNTLPETMPLYYNACDALLMTSIVEGSPNVVKEALACNLPVVSTDCGDVRERLEGVEPGGISKATAEDLAAALRPILRNPTRSNGRESVQQLADKPLAERVVKIYERAIAAHG